MNIRLDVVLNDITGQSGMAVIKAILAGQHEPEHLVSLVSQLVKKSRSEIANALQGWWREELLFELQASLNFHRLYERKIKECDQVIETFLPGRPLGLGAGKKARLASLLVVNQSGVRQRIAQES